MGKLLGGSFIAKMISNMKNFSNKNNAKKTFKLNIFSGHDTSLLAVSAGLDIHIDIPTFASCLLFELYESNSDLIVRMFYRNGNNGTSLIPLKLGQCGHTC